MHPRDPLRHRSALPPIHPIPSHSTHHACPQAPILRALLASLPKAADAFHDAVRAKLRSSSPSSPSPSPHKHQHKNPMDEIDLVQAMGARFYALFVPEAIPRAVKNSNQRLSAAIRDHPGPVAWGNTNAKAGDFKGVS